MQLRRKAYQDMAELFEKVAEKPSKTAKSAEEIAYTYRLPKSVGDTPVSLSLRF
jgi:hypothetical protein